LNVRTIGALGPTSFALSAGTTPTRVKGGTVVVVVAGSVVAVSVVAVVFGVVLGCVVDGLAVPGPVLASRALAAARVPHALRPTAMAAGRSTADKARRCLLRQLARHCPAIGALLPSIP
jgi:hypothetical protein